MSATLRAPAPPHVASASQRAAIEAGKQSLLVLAGPGAGKTFCLIERIRYLVEQLGFDPVRICAFTFTNKAAEEIASRLERQLGSRAERVKRGTIHAFCAELLREFASHVGLERGFGIADEEYQLTVLRRLEGHRAWHRGVLTRFSNHRFRGEPLLSNDAALFDGYERFLAQRNLVDFDTLVLKTAELLEHTPQSAAIRARWDVILVDEFQDLNPVQYRVIHELAREHRHVVAVGDNEQSIYSWAGADPAVFKSFVNDFGITTKVYLEENRRCPHEVFALAWRLVTINPPTFDDRVTPLADRESPFPVTALTCETDEAEVAWIIDDIRRDRAEYGFDWGEVALLYRKHDIGECIETALLNAGIPCRLAQGRALAEDPVVAYVLAALRVIGHPKDDVLREAFFASVLPRPLFDDARAQAEATGHDLRLQLNRMAARLPRAHEDGRQIRRALYAWRNLEAIGSRHTTLAPLIQDLLSHRVGKQRSVLEERHDELSDPASNNDVVRLAERLGRARQQVGEVWLPSLGGVEIPLKGMLVALGFRRVQLGDFPAQDAVAVGRDDVPSLGIALGLFKAAQLLESRDFTMAFRDFTAVDLETTERDTTSAEIVEIAAVRVRDGRPVEMFSSLVKPRVPIASGATEKHGLRGADVASAPRFEDVWPTFREFCGNDVVIAHNGYEFDFRILKRMVKSQNGRFDLCTYDTLPLAPDLYPTSRRLDDLANAFAIDPGRSHRAPDDARTLALVVLVLEKSRLARARKTALLNLLGHLGVALALSDEAALCAEAQLFRQIARPYALGRYSGALELYESEAEGNEAVPSVDEVIERLGGAKLMVKIRAERTAEELHPEAMQRLRRLIEQIPDGSLGAQLAAFLERAVLSKHDGAEPERGRVNLLTLHSTKGLEFSRVYVVGVEDTELPGHPPNKAPAKSEIEEARRLLYVGMTRAKDRLVLTRVEARGGKGTGGHQFLDEMGLVPRPPA